MEDRELEGQNAAARAIIEAERFKHEKLKTTVNSLQKGLREFIRSVVQEGTNKQNFARDMYEAKEHRTPFSRQAATAGFKQDEVITGYDESRQFEQDEDDFAFKFPHRR